MYYTIAHTSKNVSLWLHKWFMLSNRHITQPTCSSTDMSAEHRKSFNPNSQTLLMVFQLSLVSKEEQPRGAFLPATYRITVPACIVCGLPFEISTDIWRFSAREMVSVINIFVQATTCGQRHEHSLSIVVQTKDIQTKQLLISLSI